MKPAGETQIQKVPQDASSALEMMMNQYGDSVLRTAFFYMRDRHLAEDVSQEVFIRAYRKWTSFRGVSSVKTWLTKITINLCRDKLGLKSSSEEPTDPTRLQLTWQSGVEDQVLVQIRNTMILQHVLNLPAQYHEVVYLYYYLELSTSEIADATGAPEGTVRGRLHRARQLLADQLKEEGLADGRK